MHVTIAIPTYGRADKLVGMDYFKGAVYVLPQSQRDAYRKFLPAKRMVVIPDAEDGSIPRKRNWILKNMGRPVLMVDDDVKRLTTTEGVYREGKFTGTSKQMTALTPEQAHDVVVNGFNMAHELGCVFWGLNCNTDGRNYRQYKPFSMTSPVLGPFQGHLFHGLMNDERMGTKDDYDFFLQVMAKYKKALRFNKYAYDCEHGDNSGGLVSMRSMERETKYCEAVMKKWGRGVISYKLPAKKMADLLNGSVRVPISGV